MLKVVYFMLIMGECETFFLFFFLYKMFFFNFFFFNVQFSLMKKCKRDYNQTDWPNTFTDIRVYLSGRKRYCVLREEVLSCAVFFNAKQPEILESLARLVSFLY